MIQVLVVTNSFQVSLAMLRAISTPSLSLSLSLGHLFPQIGLDFIAFSEQSFLAGAGAHVFVCACVYFRVCSFNRLLFVIFARENTILKLVGPKILKEAQGLEKGE